MKSIVLETQGLKLRQLTLEDTIEMTGYLNEKELVRYLDVRIPLNPDLVAVMIKTAARKWREGTALTFGIEDRVTNQLLGVASIDDIDRNLSKATASVWVGRPNQTHGIAHESLKLIIDFAFKKLKLNKIEFHIMAINQAARTLAENLGAKYEGTLRENFRKKDELADEAIYSIMSRDWRL